MTTSLTIDRRGLLEQLIPNPDDYLIVTGLAGSARDAAELTDDGPNLYTMAGCMGAAVAMGLGTALSAPDRRVLVITGDGELMMNLGSLASVSTMAPANLSIVCIDNGCHGETGGQTGHTSNRTDLEMIAKGAGIPQTMTLVDPAGIDAAAKFLAEAAAPKFLLCRVKDGPPAAYKRNIDPAECRLRFRAHVQATG
ncbi:MAG: thiamine pyrophosphate-dependent enzyme [Magnetovibrio sp.]|nr:thiamine pyrophosphate-dependent enzyme [Magnetovibrio sp.]